MAGHWYNELGEACHTQPTKPGAKNPTRATTLKEAKSMGAAGRTCTKCKKVCQLSEFGKDKYRKDGLTSQCRECRAAKGREYKEKNRSLIREKALARYWRDPERSRRLSRQRYKPSPPNPLFHGKTDTPTYKSWGTMIQRCENQSLKKYPRYGGRGITVCERWHDFREFLKDMGEKPKGTTIERIDNDGNYEPSNCKWGTIYEQANNRSNNRNITYKGKTLTMAQWCRELGLSPVATRMRLHRGWSVEETFERKLRKW